MTGQTTAPPTEVVPSEEQSACVLARLSPIQALQIIGVLALIVIITGGIGLSIGSVLVFSGVVADKAMAGVGGAQGWTSAWPRPPTRTAPSSAAGSASTTAGPCCHWKTPACRSFLTWSRTS